MQHIGHPFTVIKPACRQLLTPIGRVNCTPRTKARRCGSDANMREHRENDSYTLQSLPLKEKSHYPPQHKMPTAQHDPRLYRFTSFKLYIFLKYTIAGTFRGLVPLVCKYYAGSFIFASVKGSAFSPQICYRTQLEN